MDDKILEGFLKPTLALICPYCEKSHKISSDIKVKVTECAKCAKKIQIPNNLEHMENLIKNLNSLELLDRELTEFRKLVLAQEEEIKVLKAGRNYIGLVPSNYHKVESILRMIKESMDQAQIEISKCFDQNQMLEESIEEEQVHEESNYEDFKEGT